MAWRAELIPVVLGGDLSKRVQERLNELGIRPRQEFKLTTTAHGLLLTWYDWSQAPEEID